MPLVSVVLTEAQALLNDVAKVIFTDVALLPFVKKAYQELQDELALNGLQEVFEEETVVGVTTPVKVLTTAVLPADFIIPIEIWEKKSGEPDTDYRDMKERRFDSHQKMTDLMGMWYWADNEIKLPGSTTNQINLKIRYLKFLTALVDANSSITILNCQTYLSARTAAIAALVIGGNAERSEIYQLDANGRMKVIIATAVKRKQSQPTRRQPFSR